MLTNLCVTIRQWYNKAVVHCIAKFCLHVCCDMQTAMTCCVCRCPSGPSERGKAEVQETARYRERHVSECPNTDKERGRER